MNKLKEKNKSSFIEKITLTKMNYILFGVGVFTIILGYFIMAKGDTNSVQSLSIAPLILLIGYLIIVPVSIMYRKKSPDTNDKS